MTRTLIDAASEIRLQEASLDDVLRYWASAYDGEPEMLDAFVDTHKRVVVFRLLVHTPDTETPFEVDEP